MTGTAIAIALTGCASRSPEPRPESCLRFEIVAAPLGDALERLPIGVADVESAEFGRRQTHERERALSEAMGLEAYTETLFVLIRLSEPAAGSLREASRRHRRRYVRVSRPGFPAFPIHLASELRGPEFSVRLRTAEGGERLARMLNQPCESAGPG